MNLYLLPHSLTWRNEFRAVHYWQLDSTLVEPAHSPAYPSAMSIRDAKGNIHTNTYTNTMHISCLEKPGLCHQTTPQTEACDAHWGLAVIKSHKEVTRSVHRDSLEVTCQWTTDQQWCWAVHRFTPNTGGLFLWYSFFIYRHKITQRWERGWMGWEQSVSCGCLVYLRLPAVQAGGSRSSVAAWDY